MDPSVRAVVVVVEAARRVVEQREVVLRLLLVAVVVVGGAVACVIALPSMRGTRSRPVTVAGRWSVVAVCSAPCSILSLSLSLSLSRVPGRTKQGLFFVRSSKSGGIFIITKVLSFLFFFLSPKRIIIVEKEKKY